MRNSIYAEIEHIASSAGWDRLTLLLLISCWAAEKDQSHSLIDYLAGLAADENGDGPDDQGNN